MNTDNSLGKTFGQLTVVDITDPQNSNKVICDCSCGKKNISVHLYRLVGGRIKSCGCNKDRYLNMTGKHNVLYTGYEELSGRHWGTIKRQAKERGISIEIDIKYAWELYVKQNKKCALSGIPIGFAKAHEKLKETASLDRIDSSKGYVEGNVQWLHKHINMMKGSYDQNYFISLCEIITKNKGL